MFYFSNINIFSPAAYNIEDLSGLNIYLQDFSTGTPHVNRGHVSTPAVGGTSDGIDRRSDEFIGDHHEALGGSYSRVGKPYGPGEDGSSSMGRNEDGFSSNRNVNRRIETTNPRTTKDVYRPRDGSSSDLSRREGGNNGSARMGSRIFETIDRVRNQGSSNSAENTRERLDGLNLQLQRLGDRLLSMETALTRRGERIDNVQYR